MRTRVVGLVVMALGGVAVLAAVTADAWVPLSPAELPLDESFGTESVGEQVRYLDPAQLAEVTGSEVTVSVRVRGTRRPAPRTTTPPSGSTPRRPATRTGPW